MRPLRFLGQFRFEKFETALAQRFHEFGSIVGIGKADPVTHIPRLGEIVSFVFEIFDDTAIGDLKEFTPGWQKFFAGKQASRDLPARRGRIDGRGPLHGAIDGIEKIGGVGGVNASASRSPALITRPAKIASQLLARASIIASEISSRMIRSS